MIVDNKRIIYKIAIVNSQCYEKYTYILSYRCTSQPQLNFLIIDIHLWIIMQGRIYISGAFTNLNYVKCKPNNEWLDNDPHFWSNPPTWVFVEQISEEC
jgi:hypothetical protein